MTNLSGSFKNVQIIDSHTSTHHSRSGPQVSFIKRLRTLVKKEHIEVKVVWLGLERAGKTTIVRRLTRGFFNEGTSRTMGLNIEEYHNGGIKFVLWDIGGQEEFRRTLWPDFVQGSAGVVFVIDSADESRFDIARRELWDNVLDNTTLTRVPILILANKQDLEEAKDEGYVARALDLHRTSSHSYSILGTSAKSGLNLKEGIDWLTARIIALQG